ncbi:MAG: hypothetical protein ACOZE5_10470 [Verrucomicrobiota bacterium]
MFSIKRRVWIGSGAAIVGVAAWAWWAWSRQVQPAGQGGDAAPFVQLAGAGSAIGSKILQERAELMDPTPLFFPTEWNYGQRPLSGSRLRQPGEVFGSFPPKPVVADQGIASYGVQALPVPEKLSDLLAQGNEAPFAGMGQTDIQTTTLAVRAGHLEVRKLGARESIVEQSLAGIQPPRADFEPIEFLVVVGSAGLICEPILLRGSGWDEVDAFFRAYLIKSYHLGERLPSGRYRVVVGA